MSDYLVIDTATGKVKHEYPALWHVWSPDRQRLAHVGLILHFAPAWAQNYCLLMNERVVYPAGCKGSVLDRRSKTFRNIHRFDGPPAWSSDGHSVSFTQTVFDFRVTDEQNGDGVEINIRRYATTVPVQGRATSSLLN